jgi:serine phosphatase RsbU (regulator of sigma subunit)
MKPGDLLVFYTDGVIETMGREGRSGPLEEYGTERLLAVARGQKGKPARAVVDAIFGSVDAWSAGAPPADDRTVMVVTYPVGGSVTMAFPRPILPGTEREGR